MLGFAVVGCGMIARFHAKALADVPGAKLTAVISRSEGNAQKLISELSLTGCKVFTQLDDALGQPNIDVVIVTTPSGAHMEPAVAAAKAGKHVVVEKPLEISLDRCDRIIEACDKN